MRGRPLVVMAGVGIAVLAWAAPAVAKGPDQATITGPGMEAPIVLTGWGEPGSGGSLADLADGSGLFLVMFPSGAEPSLTSEAPSAALGPRYEISWRVPDGTPTGSVVRQELYPLAEGGPVTHTEAGQQAMGMATIGGWYRGPANLGRVLEQIGLPTAPFAGPVPPAAQPQPQPQLDRSPASRTTPWVPVAAASLLLLMVVAGVLFGRRRSRTVGGHAPVGQRG